MSPHSVEAEQCLIASMMLESDLIGDTAGTLSRECLYQADHQIIYDVLRAMYDARKPCDVIILRDELMKRGLYEEVGGKEYLATLLSTVPGGAHGDHYARIVVEKAQLRQLISAHNDGLREAYAPQTDVKETVEKAEARIFAIAENRVAGEGEDLRDRREPCRWRSRASRADRDGRL
jgi:replicative DNA helicase